ncbi:hypothetical protein BT67DRAFT_279752 [Trichocladium antarcticum]|uniref:Uncharacterized protein n=1 Tax=Trichocladium antarcticum TaxID=1450529 RepID=A0AAN6ZF21_9PEZI|nr:hypothetical protein BT67DRAFT_279752 [Trichocladium antarcticum]
MTSTLALLGQIGPSLASPTRSLSFSPRKRQDMAATIPGRKRDGMAHSSLAARCHLPISGNGSANINETTAEGGAGISRVNLYTLIPSCPVHDCRYPPSNHRCLTFETPLVVNIVRIASSASSGILQVFVWNERNPQ